MALMQGEDVDSASSDMASPTLAAEPLHPCEHALSQRATRGEVVDASTGNPRVDSVFRGPPWGSDRIVRAEFLAHLLTGGGIERTLKMRGVRITGAVNLEGRALTCPLLLAVST